MTRIRHFPYFPCFSAGLFVLGVLAYAHAFSSRRKTTLPLLGVSAAVAAPLRSLNLGRRQVNVRDHRNVTQICESRASRVEGTAHSAIMVMFQNQVNA